MVRQAKAVAKYCVIGANEVGGADFAGDSIGAGFPKVLSNVVCVPTCAPPYPQFPSFRQVGLTADFGCRKSFQRLPDRHNPKIRP